MLVARVAALVSQQGRGRPWTLLLDNRVLPAAIAWRTNLTHQQLADPFGVGQATAHRVIDRLTPVIVRLLGPPEGSRADLWVVDGTLIPVEEHAMTARSKNYRRSVNVQIIIRAKGRRVIAVGDSWPGNCNDTVVFRATMANQIAGHRLLIGDGAYRSAPEATTCRNKSKPFAKRRTQAEQTIACSTTSRSTTRNYGTSLKPTGISPSGRVCRTAAHV
ncbi:transposase family protein [Streptomyces sp. NBC_00286]|uniref:transposase family protein n=1 Tax=Streptomyces sp. NBC_00286 TaxID=2975701 RepID=UPI002E2B33C1|nr:transposase family protein [Streptomyces sp. NBC_00286]